MTGNQLTRLALGGSVLTRWIGLAAGLLCLTGPAAAQTSTPSSPSARPPLTELLRTPRETLKTLYYAVRVYDYRPEFIDEAIACLELDDNQKADTPEAARLAIQLEVILRELSVPLNAAPQVAAIDSETIFQLYNGSCQRMGMVKADNATVILYQGNECTIAVHRQTDGLWRFDRATLARIPAMYRAVLARHRDLDADRKGLREGYTDAYTTMRHFVTDCLQGDYYAAAQALDLSGLSTDQRADQGPVLAQQLACVVQRAGWTFFQEIPNRPSAPSYTWHADRTGRIVLERVKQRDGVEAWLFTRQTVANLPRMYQQALSRQPDVRWVRLGKVVPVLPSAVTAAALKQRPASVPHHLSSPRAVLMGFFRCMDEADTSDAKQVEALDYLDLGNITQANRRVVGTKLAAMLEAVLRKLEIDLSVVSEDWNAPPMVRGQRQGLRVEIARQRDGCWRFSQATLAQVPGLYDKVAAQEKADRNRASQLESARDTMATFLAAVNAHDYELAGTCLDLQAVREAARDEVGPVLAFKLKYVIDRIGRVYIQSVPDEPNGARYIFYRGDLGRIVLSRKDEGRRKGSWLFTAETVRRIEPMFRAAFNTPPARGLDGIDKITSPTLAESPGIWLRTRLPAWVQRRVWRLEVYQWLGLALAALSGWLVSRLILGPLYRLTSWRLRCSGSCLTLAYVFQKMRPLTWVVAWWLFFRLFAFMDLPMNLLDAVVPLKRFGLAVLLGWLGFQIIDLVTAICTNSELLKPHRNLSEMVVPVLVRALKGVVIIIVLIDLVYQLGQGDSLTHFLTGLGVAGLAVSLAAQDGLKSFFGTLLLISERSFKLGDHIQVGSQEGTVEQVGFRSTRLRTPEGSLLTIPNSTIAAAGIDNLGVKSFRPYSTSVLVGYETAAADLGRYREGLLQWLRQHPGIDHDKAKISIERFTEHGVELTLSLLLANGSEEQKVKDDINLEILRQAQILGIGLADSRKPAPAAEEPPAREAAPTSMRKFRAA